MRLSTAPECVELCRFFPLRAFMAPPRPALPCPHRARAPHRRFAQREYGAVPCLVHDSTRSMIAFANCQLAQLVVGCGTLRPEPCRTSRARPSISMATGLPQSAVANFDAPEARPLDEADFAFLRRWHALALPPVERHQGECGSDDLTQAQLAAHVYGLACLTCVVKQAAHDTSAQCCMCREV
jgi:hypothetical protein